MVSEIYTLTTNQWLPRSLDEVFEFFSRPENLQSITPAWLDFRIVQAPSELKAGALIRYSLRWRFVPLRWLTEITVWDPPHRFVDKQISGPYVLWEHEHKFTHIDGGTRISDTVRYSLPFGPVGRMAHRGWVKSDLEAIFRFRNNRIAELLGSKLEGEIGIRR